MKTKTKKIVQMIVILKLLSLNDQIQSELGYVLFSGSARTSF